MYPIAPGVVMMLPVTPSFPFDLVPTGQLGIVFAPTLLLKSSLIAPRCCEKTNDVPLLSARTTTLIGRSGSFAPGFVLAICGSFHLVILPRNTPAYAWRDNWRLSTSLRL